MNQKFAVIMHGTTGSGKTTLANILTKYLDAKLLSTSQIKHKKGWRGIEYESKRNEVYSTIVGLIRDNIEKGKPVVVDATFSLRRWREDVYAVCSELNIPLYIIQCVCDNAIEVSRRIGKRTRENPTSPDSEATHVGYWITEKKNIEELLVDQFPKPEQTFILVCDTYRKVITPVFLSQNNNALFEKIQDYVKKKI